MAANLNFVQNIKNALSGENGNRCVFALFNASVTLKDKLYASDKKRIIIPLALPVGLIRGALFTGAYYPAMAIDRIANAIQTTRNPDLSGKEKLKKWAFLPLKLAIILPAIPTGIALIPLFAIGYTIRALIALRKHEDLSVE